MVLAVAVMSATVIALGIAAWARLRGTVVEYRARVVRDRWGPPIDGVIAGVAVPSPILRWRERRAVLRLWCHYQESLAGTASDALNRFASRAGLDVAARQLLRSRLLPDRMLAVTAIGHLRDEASWPDILAFAHESSPLWEPAARALVRIDAESAVRTLAPAMGTAHLARSASAIAAAAPHVVAGALGDVLLETEGADAQVHLLRLIASTRSPRGLDAVRRLLDDVDDPEIIAASLRVLAAVRDPRDAVTVRSYAAHPAWFIRLHAAEALGRMGCREDEGALFGLLEDREWLVRRAAADALSSARFSPPPWLHAVSESHPDEGARVALAHALAERAAVC
jgi:HEAT repeat protein